MVDARWSVDQMHVGDTHTHTHTRPAKSKGHETGKVCVKQRVWPRDEHDKMPVVTRERCKWTSISPKKKKNKKKERKATRD